MRYNDDLTAAVAAEPNLKEYPLSVEDVSEFIVDADRLSPLMPSDPDQSLGRTVQVLGALR